MSGAVAVERVLPPTTPAVLVPPPGVGDPLSARPGSLVGVTRRRACPTLTSGAGE